MHAEVTEDAFGEDHRPCGRRPDPAEEFPAGVAVGQVQTDPFDRTRRNLGAQLGILAFDEAGMVNLDPVEGRGKIHPVRTGVHPSPRLMTVSIPDEIAERMNASIKPVRMATTHAPSGRVLAIRRPRSPARPAASGSWNNASDRLDSIARHPAVSRADSDGCWITSSSTSDVYRC